MQLDQYLRALAGDGEALAAAAEVDLDVPVDACPGWNVARLVGHTGRIHRWATEMIRTNTPERLDRTQMAAAPDGAALVPWFREGVVALGDTLRSAGPDAAVWTWRAEHTSAFWHRRMAQETSVHRWDAERAVGSPSPIAPELAADGIDELLDIFVPRARPEGRDSPAGRIHLSATDIDREWDLAHGDTGAVGSGSASNLLLFVWGRVRPEELDTSGDGDLLRRWQADMQI